MTYKEREAALCLACDRPEICGYYKKDLQRKCLYLRNVMYGWELGQQDTLDAVQSYADKGNSDWTSNFMKGLKETLK